MFPKLGNPRSCGATERSWMVSSAKVIRGDMLVGAPFLLRGNWYIAVTAELTRTVDQVMIDTCKEIGNPPVLLFDLRPMIPPMLMIFDWEVAEQITKSSPTWNSSCPKSPTMRPIYHLTGKRSILVYNVNHLTPSQDGLAILS